MTRPNLFHFATTELSQDAALCWLLEWADAESSVEDPALHRLGRDFVALLFKEAAAGGPPTGAIRVRKQHYDVDVVAEVGTSHVLAIEDKVHTDEHSRQLERYQRTLRKAFPGRLLVLVYLKTGDQASYQEVRKQGWAVVTRKQMLGLFDAAAEVRNDIFSDYRSHLRGLESRVEAFRRMPPSTWEPRSLLWHGFFLELQERFRPLVPDYSPEWGYVSNPAGGFIGCWWGFWRVLQGVVHIQLAEDRLVVKVRPERDEWQTVLRDRWVERLIADASWPKFVRPKRLSRGEHMTVALYDGEYRTIGPDGLIDVDATMKLLWNATQKVAKLANAS